MCYGFESTKCGEAVLIPVASRTIVRNANGCHGFESTKCGEAVLISGFFYGKISLSIAKCVHLRRTERK